MKRTIILPFALVLIFISCVKRDWTNPFDPASPKEMWTPTNFSAAQEGTNVKLTWSQPIKNISGFKLTKKLDTGAATDLQTQTKDATQLIDASPTGGKMHTYSIVAYAGNNSSNVVTVQIMPILAAGITTTAVSSVTANSFISGGTVTSDGGATVTSRGLCWSTNQNPTIADRNTLDGASVGSFTTTVTGLNPGITYYIRAYATNSKGTTYGNQVSTATPANLPALATATVSAVTTSTAIGGGTITSDGGGAITARGVCWSTSQNPTIANNKTSDGSGTGTFASSITGLSSATTYYLRAYATNSAGTAYGQQEICVSSYGTISDVDGNNYQTINIGSQIWMRENLKTTKYKDGTAIPLVTDNTTWTNLTTPGYCWYNNDAITNKNTYGALYNWFTVTTNKLCPTGWHVPTSAEWSTLSNYLGGDAVSGGKLKETATSHWTAPNTGATNETGFTGLPGGCRFAGGAYYYLNGDGRWWSSTLSTIDRALQFILISYGGNGSQSTSDFGPGYSVRCISGELSPPTLTTTSANSITTTSAVSGGNISTDGGTAVTARGVCWSTTATPTISNSKTSDGTGMGSFSSSITGLTAGTTYYVRAYATNSAGTSYGTEMIFSTSATLPTITTTAITSFDTATAISGGNITSAGNGSITARGVCWYSASGPTISNYKTIDGTGIGIYSSTLTGLIAGITYYLRSYATNSFGTVYGNEITLKIPVNVISFNPILKYGSIIDNDGNTYKTIQIGSQLWMAENLKTTKYNDNTSIPLTTDAANWMNLTTPSYCWNRNDLVTFKDSYGALYNWYTVNTNKLCPKGWHVPTYNDWTKLTSFLGGNGIAGVRLKEAGSNHWIDQINDVSNESGFTALPGGSLTGVGPGSNVGYHGLWWSSSENASISAVGVFMETTNPYVQYSNYIKTAGFSVRCISDLTVLPTLITTIISNITSIFAASGGNITSDGGSIVTAKGVCWSTTSGPTIANSKTTDGTGTGSFTSSISGLTPGTIYYLRAYATSSAGTAYGNEISFKTAALLPTINSSSILSITYNSAICNGSISSDGGASVTARGVCWSTAHNPTIANSKTINGTGIGNLTDTIKGLSNNITYYLRAYATNSIGTVYGNENSFILYMNVPDASITDIDGNAYKTVRIGNQIWMAENLKVTKYRDGTAIPNVTDGNSWGVLTTGAYCNLNNDFNNVQTYGRMYNYFSATNIRGISPAGWHIPTAKEWKVLINYLGGRDLAGSKLKESANLHWVTPNTDANNASGFTALPAGDRWCSPPSLFYFFGVNAFFRAIVETLDETNYIMLNNQNAAINDFGYQADTHGISIRCVKN